MRKHVLLAFLLALAFYAGSFAVDHHLRTRKGPWVVTFTNNISGSPAIVISQSSLGLSNVTLALAGELATNVCRTIRFDVPQQPVPYGTVLFEDLTYLPGTVTLDMFGHEIELLPRVLTINRREFAWRSGFTVVLTPEQKPPPRPTRKKPP